MGLSKAEKGGAISACRFSGAEHSLVYKEIFVCVHAATHASSSKGRESQLCIISEAQHSSGGWDFDTEGCSCSCSCKFF